MAAKKSQGMNPRTGELRGQQPLRERVSKPAGISVSTPKGLVDATVKAQKAGRGPVKQKTVDRYASAEAGVRTAFAAGHAAGHHAGFRKGVNAAVARGNTQPKAQPRRSAKTPVLNLGFQPNAAAAAQAARAIMAKLPPMAQLMPPMPPPRPMPAPMPMRPAMPPVLPGVRPGMPQPMMPARPAGRPQLPPQIMAALLRMRQGGR